MISDEAVESAAKGAFRRTHPHGNWRLAISKMRERYLDEARAALEAAAPHMVAERSVPPLTEAEWDDLRQLPNPYRSQA